MKILTALKKENKWSVTIKVLHEVDSREEVETIIKKYGLKQQHVPGNLDMIYAEGE